MPRVSRPHAANARVSRPLTPPDLRSVLGDGTQVAQSDPWLEPFQDQLRMRQEHFLARLAEIEAEGGLLGPISQGFRYFGFQRGVEEGRAGYWYREWAPGATELSLIGDFNGWDRRATPLKSDERGIWSVFVADADFEHPLAHGARVKVHVVAPGRGGEDRIPAYARRAVQDETGDFAAQLWDPPTPFEFRHSPPPHLDGGLRIYEAHVGMSSEQERVSTFAEFTRDVLPRVADLGYNAIQLMAVKEHPYYGSFGYQVANFFAVSSRFGTPEDLKALIDAAHARGMVVLLDLIHSHAVKNTREGLNWFDGTSYQYFHAGPRGEHPAWNSKVFDYGKPGVLSFLLSNVRFWLEEFRFDGFRFDGVTSMIYVDHGLGRTFAGYGDYFGINVDEDAVTYLKLANLLAHSVNPRAITVAEDVSGMVGMARPVEEGGLGFDYRLAMGVPDYWIKLVKEKRDEDWNLGELWHTLLNRRRDERHVGYAESHDQALVGDKTLAFRLMDQEMYWNMTRLGGSPVVDRGVALHKLIRLITFSLAGEAWLNFMGNEFGHPEWIDFPRQGNGFSYRYARRQWSLAERDDLRYRGLLEFDRALQTLDREHGVLTESSITQLMLHENEKILAYRRGPLVFVFNFHATESYPALRIPVPEARDYRVLLDTDERRFDGQGRVAAAMRYPWQDRPQNGEKQSLELYLPNRSAQVLAPV